MGDAMEEGTILRWLKSEGERVAEQEIIAEIQTEKANIEIPAVEAGVLTKILVREGQTVPVGTTIAQLDGPTGAAPAAKEPAAKPAKEAPTRAAPKEAADAPKANGDSGQKVGGDAAAPASPDADLSQREPEPAAAAAAPAVELPMNGGRVRASPLARKIAAEHGLDLTGMQGTGPGGRIIEADIEEALRSGPAVPAAQGVPATADGAPRPMSPMRKIIARRLLQSKQTIPHFYLSLDVDMRAAAGLRSQYNASVGEEKKISFNDFVVRACVLALEKFPQLKSQIDGETIRTSTGTHIGVAVALDEGLIVPVVRDAQGKSISILAQEIRSLAERARKGQLTPAEYGGGTLSVTNLGMYEVTQFQAIINPPEAAIVAVGAVRDTPIVEDGQVIAGKQMYLTISADHRIVDGHVAALYMQAVKRLLQTPIALFG